MIVHHLAPIVGWHTVHLVSETLEHIGGVLTAEVVVLDVVLYALLFCEASEGMDYKLSHCWKLLMPDGEPSGTVVILSGGCA